jgi:hypothetical protein
MHYLKSLIVVLFILFSVNISQAEPSSNMKYLMNKPISIMDWGLINIDLQLRKLTDKTYAHELKEAQIIAPSVIYNRGTNRIIIHIGIGGANTKEQAKEWCKSTVDKIRSMFFINLDTGKPYSVNGALYFYFTHVGYSKKSEPKGLSEELDNITVIKVEVIYQNSKSLICEAPLLGTSVMFQE